MASRIAELSEIVSSSTRTIDQYLTANSLPKPSFSEDGPVELGLSTEVEAARYAAINASAELQALLQGPKDHLRPIMNATSLEAISRYDIASKVPIGGEITFDELAKQCGLFETDLRRIVRFAIAYHHIFREPRKGVLAHSAASKWLVDNEGAHDGLGVMFDDCYQSFGRTVEAMEKYKDQDPSHTGWALAHDGMSLFETFGRIPAKAKRFAGSMASFNASPLMSHVHLVQHFPWGDMGPEATVVDLGGSHGELCAAVAAEHSNVRGVVQELPRTVQSVDRNQLPLTVRNRIEFMEHDFFTPQPMTAEVYVFRQIFHNWPDAHVVKILRQLIPGLRRGSRVVVHEMILPEPGTMSLMQDRQIRAMDMLMLSICNARERDEADWRSVFAEADPGFRVLRVFTPKGSALGIVDVEWS